MAKKRGKSHWQLNLDKSEFHFISRQLRVGGFVSCSGKMNKLTSLLCSNTTRCFVRNYAFKSDLKIKWVRPEKISCIRPEKSGDLQAAEVIPPSTTLLAFQQSEELKE